MRTDKDQWSELKRRERNALTAFLVALPAAMLVAVFVESGAAYFITFMAIGVLSVLLRIHAMHTPCPGCQKPFCSSRRLIRPPKSCSHCGLVRDSSDTKIPSNERQT